MANRVITGPSATKDRASHIQCRACKGWFDPEPETNIIFPICPWCLQNHRSPHHTGRTVWRAYLMVDLAAQGIGPFKTREERSQFYTNMHRTHPHLVGERIDCLEEPETLGN